MRWTVCLFLVLLASHTTAADRQWQMGTWADVGISRNPLVGDPRSGSAGVSSFPSKRGVPEVGRYVIETSDTRYTVEDSVALGAGSFDLSVKVGARVTFAVSKNTVFIKGDGTEYRLRLVKKEARRQ
jgi:hypothetical protein